ncbi:MAG: hypothetical protein IPK76_03000 [Lewinellaceae bacterium]|nr:hypothetical protein [Lewinellaceae bacterium]
MKPEMALKSLLRPPAPLRRLDDYLLKHYPLLWRLRAHYVLFYWLLAALALFLSGYFMLLNFYSCVNDGWRYRQNAAIIALLIAFIGLLSLIIWRNKLSGINQISGIRWYFVLIEVLVYSTGMAVIALSSLAFLFGVALKPKNIWKGQCCFSQRIFSKK